MARPPLRVPVTELRAGEQLLPDEVARYVTRVHRRLVGDRLVLFQPASGKQAAAVLLSERPARVQVDEPESAVSQALPVHLLQSLGKGDKPEQVVRDATALGAQSVTLLHAERSVAKGEGERRSERLQRVMVEAARQSGRGDIPELWGPTPILAALAVLPAPVEGEGRVVAALQDAAVPLLTALRRWVDSGTLGPIRVLLGPEGGLSDEEVNAAVAAGFEVVSLGANVLRTETAATAVLGALCFLVDEQAS